MKRSTRFAVGIIAASITFASLMVFAKPIHRFKQHDRSHFGYDHPHGCNRSEVANKRGIGPDQAKEPAAVDSLRPAQ